MRHSDWSPPYHHCLWVLMVGGCVACPSQGDCMQEKLLPTLVVLCINIPLLEMVKVTGVYLRFQDFSNTRKVRESVSIIQFSYICFRWMVWQHSICDSLGLSPTRRRNPFPPSLQILRISFVLCLLGHPLGSCWRHCPIWGLAAWCEVHWMPS